MRNNSVYQANDDKEVPFEQLFEHRQRLSAATYRKIETGGHQLDNDLSIEEKDIKQL